MRADAERLRCDLVERLLDRKHRFSWGKPGAVSDSKNMRIDRKSFRPERSIHHHIGGLSPDPGKRLERIAVGRHLASMIADQIFRKRDHVLGLVVEQADGLDMLFQAIDAQRDHLRGCLDLGKQRPRRLVHPDIGGLRRTHDGDQQLINIAVRKLGFGRRVRFRELPVEFEDVGLFQRPTPVTRAT